MLRRLPDYSYGIYIYAFPLQQFLIMVRPEYPPFLNACLVLAVVLVPAGLSWHFVKKPALALKKPRVAELELGV
jgi:peptidoglycan/LPS O-acetylase OafA/YrhL